MFFKESFSPEGKTADEGFLTPELHPHRWLTGACSKKSSGELQMEKQLLLQLSSLHFIFWVEVARVWKEQPALKFPVTLKHNVPDKLEMPFLNDWKSSFSRCFCWVNHKSYCEITWKREKKMVLDRISTRGATFRATRRKKTGCFLVLVQRWNLHTFKGSRDHSPCVGPHSEWESI